MTRIVVSGIFGRTPSRIADLVQKDAACELIGGIVKSLGSREKKSSFKLSTKVKDLMTQADVLIEFTNPAATLTHLRELESLKGKAAVVGTTGLEPQQKQELENLAKKLPIVFDSNFSLGIALLKRLLSAGLKNTSSFDCHIVETHHKKKKDAPSGTAKDLAGHIADLIGVYPATSSLRLGEVPGEHTVVLANPYEVVELTHRVYTRDAFAHGAIVAAKWVAHQKPGLYRFQTVGSDLYI